jgi:two-component system NarL family response regulator
MPPVSRDGCRRRTWFIPSLFAIVVPILSVGTLQGASVSEGATVGADPIRVLIADDHALFRRALEMVLQGEPGIELVGQAADGAEAVQLAGATLPDVVLMDIRMPKITGIEAARQVRKVAPSAKIVMLTSSDEEDDRSAAIRAGASGYLLKDIPLDEVAGAVRALIR